MSVVYWFIQSICDKHIIDYIYYAARQFSSCYSFFYVYIIFAVYNFSILLPIASYYPYILMTRHDKTVDITILTPPFVRLLLPLFC